jgi:DNA-binding beta-propeller fold protein YncE
MPDTSVTRRLALLVAGVLGLGVLIATPAGAVTTAPTYVRTIGSSGQAALYPSGLDVDAAGNVYVADTGNDQVEMYPAGSTTPAWTRGIRGATYANGNFSNPRDIAVGSTHLYVADTDHYLVQVLNLDGTYVGKLAFPFRSPIGVSVGTDGSGHQRILVSDGGSGNVEIFDQNEQHVMTIPPKLSANAGTRDAATDPQGNIYAADYRDSAIHKYNAAGQYIKSWGGKGSAFPTCLQINRPYGVDVDDQGNVYVASSDKNVVREFDGQGNCIKTYGAWGQTDTTLSQLRRVAVSSGSNPRIYAADLWGIKILIYNQNGSIWSRLGGRPYPAAGGLNEVHGVAVDANHVYAADTVNQRAQRFDLDGTNPLTWGNKGVSVGGFNWPQGVGVSPANGKVWVVDTRNYRLQEFGTDGTGTDRVVGTRGPGQGAFNWPMSVTFDAAGNLYVADTFNNRIQSFTPNLAWRWTYAGTVAGNGVGQLRRPYGIDYDAAGDRLLVADTLNNRVVALSTTGSRLGIYQYVQGTQAGQVKRPYGITVETTGAFWLADTENNRIERFNANGTFANELLGGPAYGTGNMKLNFPTSLTMGPDGLLYVADTYNDRIQVFQP